MMQCMFIEGDLRDSLTPATLLTSKTYTKYIYIYVNMYKYAYIKKAHINV